MDTGLRDVIKDLRVCLEELSVWFLYNETLRFEALDGGFVYDEAEYNNSVCWRDLQAPLHTGGQDGCNTKRAQHDGGGINIDGDAKSEAVRGAEDMGTVPAFRFVDSIRIIDKNAFERLKCNIFGNVVWPSGAASLVHQHPKLITLFRGERRRVISFFLH